MVRRGCWLIRHFAEVGKVGDYRGDISIALVYLHRARKTPVRWPALVSAFAFCAACHGRRQDPPGLPARPERAAGETCPPEVLRQKWPAVSARPAAIRCQAAAALHQVRRGPPSCCCMGPGRCAAWSALPGSALPVTVSASAAGIHHHGRHGHHDTRASFHHAPPRAVEAPPYGGADPRAPRAPVFLNARARRYCARITRALRVRRARELPSFYIFLFNFIHLPRLASRARAPAREQFKPPVRSPPRRHPSDVKFLPSAFSSSGVLRGAKIYHTF